MTTEKEPTAREEWLDLENQWIKAHIIARDLREKADKARMKVAAILQDEMNAKAMADAEAE